MKQMSGGISNGNTRNRTRQILILFIAIVIGVLISQAASAQRNFHKSKIVHSKIKYKVQVHKSNKVCDILNKKRNYASKTSPFASNQKPKPKPQAEIDTPARF